jgi:hypothetical protein
MSSESVLSHSLPSYPV